jgi:hypothetical protein
MVVQSLLQYQLLQHAAVVEVPAKKVQQLFVQHLLLLQNVGGFRLSLKADASLDQPLTL